MSTQSYSEAITSCSEFFDYQNKIDNIFVVIEQKYGLKKHEFFFLMKLNEVKEVHLKDAIEKGYIKQNKSARAIKRLFEKKYILKKRLKTDERAVILRFNDDYKDDYKDDFEVIMQEVLDMLNVA
ncbi:transcriptional regulator, SarA/Rot family [Mammaliicoccus lentus]